MSQSAPVDDPAGLFRIYLKLLTAMSKTFENGEKLPFVLAASDAKTLWKELNKATRVAVPNLHFQSTQGNKILI